MADMETRGWQPIETAPRDRAIDLWAEDKGLMMPPRRFPDCYWDQEYREVRGILTRANGPWKCIHGGVPDNPTHWMPLPIPPDDTGGG